MNIFILSEQIDPIKHYQQNAEFHADKHVIKMIAESTQMLVSTILSHGDELSTAAELRRIAPCKSLSASMHKHPCTLWTAQSINHFNYLACLALSLCSEHQYRYPLSPTHAYMQWIQDVVNDLGQIGLGYIAPIPSTFAVAVKDASLRSVAVDHLKALDIYRKYYVTDKARFATWRKRLKPVWFMLLEESIAALAGDDSRPKILRVY